MYVAESAPPDRDSTPNRVPCPPRPRDTPRRFHAMVLRPHTACLEPRRRLSLTRSIMAVRFLARSSVATRSAPKRRVRRTRISRIDVPQLQGRIVRHSGGSSAADSHHPASDCGHAQLGAPVLHVRERLPRPRFGIEHFAAPAPHGLAQEAPAGRGGTTRRARRPSAEAELRPSSPFLIRL